MAAILAILVAAPKTLSAAISRPLLLSVEEGQANSPLDGGLQYTCRQRLLKVTWNEAPEPVTFVVRYIVHHFYLRPYMLETFK